MESMSKRAKKRAEKRQFMLETRSEWRKAEKLKKKQKKALRVSMGLPLANESTFPRHVSKRMAESDCRVHVAIDMSFDHLMSDKEMRQALVQLQYAYSVNRRSANPLQLYFTSFTGSSRQIFDQTHGTGNWDVFVEDAGHAEVSNRARLETVYLSAESPNVLEELNEKQLYVIGGLVDHNAHKGLCYQNAVSAGLKHAQLPIAEFLDMKTRKVLTINHVFEILLQWTVTKDWEKAFLEVIPKRKGAKGLPSDAPQPAVGGLEAADGTSRRGAAGGDVVSGEIGANEGCNPGGVESRNPDDNGGGNRTFNESGTPGGNCINCGKIDQCECGDNGGNCKNFSTGVATTSCVTTIGVVVNDAASGGNCEQETVEGNSDIGGNVGLTSDQQGNCDFTGDTDGNLKGDNSVGVTSESKGIGGSEELNDALVESTATDNFCAAGNADTAVNIADGTSEQQDNSNPHCSSKDDIS